MPDQVRIDRDGAVLVATLDNPPHGLMTRTMVLGLAELVEEVERDETIGAVVLRGAHPDRFVAHYDVAELLAGARSVGLAVSSRVAGGALRTVSAVRRIPGAGAVLQRTPAAGLAELEFFHDVLLRFNKAPAVFIAALDGSALGGGCEVALACDIRILADEGVLIGQPEILLGIIPGGGGTQRLARLLGGGWAAELVLEGRALDPDEAYALGMVHELVPREQVLDRAIERAHRLANRPRVAVAAAKRAIYFGGSEPLERGLHIERAAFMETLSSESAKRLLAAYLEHVERTGELPAYDAEAREALLAGTFAPGDLA